MRTATRPRSYTPHEQPVRFAPSRASLLLAQPRLLPLAVGADSAARGSDWLIRMVALREIVLGIGVLCAARRRRDPRPWLLSSAATDGAECLVVLDAIARRQLPRVPALGFAAADLGGALVAVGVRAQQRRDRARRNASAAASSEEPPRSTSCAASRREGMS